jgi:hypothetical protein
MSLLNLQPLAQEDGPLVFMSEIVRDNAVTDRGVRKWQANGKFPRPDGNLNGRNFWKRPTYRQWQADVLAGRYSRRSNLSRPSAHPGAMS